MTERVFYIGRFASKGERPPKGRNQGPNRGEKSKQDKREAHEEAVMDRIYDRDDMNHAIFLEEQEERFGQERKEWQEDLAGWHAGIKKSAPLILIGVLLTTIGIDQVIDL